MGNQIKPTPTYAQWAQPSLYEQTRRPVDEAHTLPGLVYHDESFFEAEKERIFSFSWVAVAETAEINSPGDLKSVSVGGVPVLLSNDRGTIRAFHNVCRHRGAKLVDKPCSRQGTILCPYHHWGYSLDGRLRATPHFDDEHKLPAHVLEQLSMSHVKDFKKESNSLFPIRVELALGLVFINLSEDAPALSEWLGDLLPALADYEKMLGLHGPGLKVYDRKEYKVQANWKLLMENYLEYYHLPAVHPELCGVSGVDEHRRNQGKGMYMCFVTDPLTKGGTPIDPGRLSPYETLRPRNRDRAYHVAIFPNTFFSLYPDALFRIILSPTSAGTTVEYATFMSHDGAFGVYDADGKEVLRDMFEFWDLINTQDIGIVENVHEGTSTPLYRGGRFSFRFEEPVHRFQNMVVDKMIANLKTRFHVPVGDVDYALMDKDKPDDDQSFSF